MSGSWKFWLRFIPTLVIAFLASVGAVNLLEDTSAEWLAFPAAITIDAYLAYVLIPSVTDTWNKNED